KEHCPDWQHQDCPNYWVISRLSNELGASVSLAYSIGFWHMDHQTTWILREDSLSEIHFAGFHTPLRLLGPEIQIYTKILNRRKVSISFEMRAKDTVTILSKIVHRSTNVFSLGPRIATNQFMAQLSLQEVNWHRIRILFQAMYLILILFYLGNFALNRQLEYLLFVGYSLCMAMILLQIGNLQAFVLPNAPALFFRLLHIAQALLPDMYAGFLYYFLEIPRTLPRLVPMFKFMIGLSLAVTLGVILFQLLSADWMSVDTLLNYFLLVSLWPLLLFIVFAFLRRKKAFIYFLLASAALFLGGCSYFVLIYARLPELSEFGLQTGLFAEVLIFAMGLGDKNRQANYERARLEAIDQIKTRLYTNLTHEFRTPLTVILGMVNQIEGHEKERRLIHRNSENILRLINQLLDLSKLDAGAMSLDLVQGDVVNYIRYLTQSFESLATDKGLNLVFHAD
ncbi:MAG: sensor histidine kinase, partial [Phaeodactylibacter sp.]|nr:sensor histidine kinase [Phaeodactylibacter sp.]